MTRTLLAFVFLLAATSAMAIPKVNPVHSKDYKVGCYYFPGWNSAARWAPIDKAGYPKPLLGFYKEGEAEVAEWHLKWAAEHGIDFFIYDWYWSKGGRGLEHALHDGYFNAKNRKYVQFCLLWANHNPPGSHSMDDFMKVTDYWLKHYFKRPEYFKVDGKPMVVFFVRRNIKEDLGGSDKVREALDAMRAKARAAGLPGIYFVASQDFNAGNSAEFKSEGWDAATSYNYPGAGMHGERRASYQRMVNGYEAIWKQIDDHFQIPYMVPITPGWDNTPWDQKDPLVRFGNSPRLFEEMCRRAKKFMDERPPERAPRIAICEAWNEFGEGSYIEPTRQFGFGMLDAIRNVFTDVSMKHTDVTPELVGDRVPQAWPPSYKTEWGRASGFEDWAVSHGVKSLDTKANRMTIVAGTTDPAVVTALSIDAKQLKALEIRMKTTAPGPAQFFWDGSEGPISEQTSVSIDTIGDNKYHTYEVDLTKNPKWTGTISILRFDPSSVEGSTTVVDYIKLK